MKKAAHPLNITDVVAAVLRQSAPNGCQFHEKMVIDPVHAVTGIRDDGRRISSRSMARVRPWKG